MVRFRIMRGFKTVASAFDIYKYMVHLFLIFFFHNTVARLTHTTRLTRILARMAR